MRSHIACSITTFIILEIYFKYIMPESIFNAVDTVAVQGLEAMLQEVVRAGTEAGEYRQAAEARYHLKRIELGLPEEDKRDDPLGDKARWEQVNVAWRNFNAEAGEQYKREGKWKEAAFAFYRAERNKDMVEMYVQEGSERSLRCAARFAIEGVDPKLGLDIIIRLDGIYAAFRDLIKIPPESQQGTGDYLIQMLYRTVVQKVTAMVEKKEGKKPEESELPESFSRMVKEVKPLFDRAITEDRTITECRAIISGISEMYGVSEHIENSTDPESIRVGIELMNYSLCYTKCCSDNKGQQEAEEVKRFLTAKLNGTDSDIHYFFEKAEQENKTRDVMSGNNRNARKVIDILQIHRKYSQALEAAERFLSPEERHHIVLPLLEKMGKYDRLATVWKGLGDPVRYALALAKKDTSV